MSRLSSGGSAFTVLGKCHRIRDPRVPGPKAWALPLPHEAPVGSPSCCQLLHPEGAAWHPLYSAVLEHLPCVRVCVWQGVRGRTRGQSFAAPACCVLFPPQSSVPPAALSSVPGFLEGVLGALLPALRGGSGGGGGWAAVFIWVRCMQGGGFLPSLSLWFFLCKGGLCRFLRGCSGLGGWHSSLGQAELCTHGREDCFTPCLALMALAPRQPGCRVSGCPEGTG